jgi:hypothetical protein
MRNRDSENYKLWKKWNYFLNRDKICLRQKKDRLTWTDEKRAEMAEKQQQYYLARKAAGVLERDKLKRKMESEYRMEQTAEVAPLVAPEKEKKQRKPRPSRYVKKIKEPSVFGTEHLQSYQKKKLIEKAPNGFYERPEGENPFHLTWD